MRRLTLKSGVDQTEWSYFEYERDDYKTAMGITDTTTIELKKESLNTMGDSLDIVGEAWELWEISLWELLLFEASKTKQIQAQMQSKTCP